MKSKIFILLPIIWIFWSCQEVIQIDLNEGPQRLVVEGRIEKIKGQVNGNQKIRLTTTGNYFSNQPAPPASDAFVTVSDEQGNIFSFIESGQEPGVYEVNDLFAETGQTYTLRIDYRGEIYEAREILLPVADIDSIYQEFKSETLFDEAGIRIKIDFTDPPQPGNYYYWEQFRDDEIFINPNPGTKWTLVSSDEFFNGLKVVGREPNNDMAFEPGQRAKVRQYAISDQLYNYMFLLYDQATGGGPTDAPPATLRGNIQNISNPDNYPLGYFGASEVSEAELLVR